MGLMRLITCLNMTGVKFTGFRIWAGGLFYKLFGRCDQFSERFGTIAHHKHSKKKSDYI